MLAFLIKKKRIAKNRGFTLIELLITISIFVILTSVVLFSQTGFNDSILLSNLAYDVSLTIRQAQQYGSGVRESLSSVEFPSYGVYYSATKLGKNSFIVFANPAPHWEFFGDNTQGTQYNGTPACLFGDPQCVQKYTLRNGAYIKSLCAGTIDNCVPANEMYLIFSRPKPNANIYSDTGNQGGAGSQSDYAKIVISSASGATTSVVVTGFGQIYVSK